MSRIEELEAKIAEISAELEALKAQPEWVPFPGEIVEVSDGLSQWIVRKFHSMRDRRYMTHGGALWNFARPLSDSNVIQLRPHTPGEPMPCRDDVSVIVRFGDGAHVTDFAGNVYWDAASKPRNAIVAWAPLQSASA